MNLLLDASGVISVSIIKLNIKVVPCNYAPFGYTPFFIGGQMNKVLIFGIILFIVLFILLYFYYTFKMIQVLNKKSTRKNKEKFLFPVKYLSNKFKIDKNVLLTKKMVLIYSLVDSFIMSLVVIIIELIPLPFAIQLLIGFILLFALIYSIYELLGRYISKKEGLK